MADIQPGRNEPNIPEKLEGRSKINVNYWCLCNKCIRFTNTNKTVMLFINHVHCKHNILVI